MKRRQREIEARKRDRIALERNWLLVNYPVERPYFWKVEEWCKESGRPVHIYRPRALRRRAPISLEEALPNRLVLWRPRKRHAIWNQARLREAARKLRIHYYREMPTDVLRAVLMNWAQDEGLQEYPE